MARDPLLSSGAETVRQRLAAIRENIARAAERAGREPDAITLLGASKRQPLAVLRAAFDAGLRSFGENRVQEAEEKSPRLPDEIEWHLIGPLQSNKARRAAELFATVHSIDRLKIARALDRHAGDLGRRISCFLEINLGGEDSKHGFAPGDLEPVLAPLAELTHLEVVGLMAIPPRETEPERARDWFRRLAALARRVGEQPGWGGFPALLSMGMSGDYELAIEEGATHVRVGTALFGARPRA